MPFFLLLPVGLTGAWQWDMGDIFRDVWYVVNPILVLLAGGVFSEKIQGDISVIFKAILIAAVIFSLLHLYQAFEYRSEWESLSDMGFEGSWPVQKGSVLVVMAIAILLYSEVYRFVTWNIEIRVLITFICITSLVLAASRSWWLSFIILTGVFSLLKVKNIKSIFALGSLLLLILLLFFVFFPPSDMETCSGVFYCKVLNSVQELIPHYYFLNQDIAVYWRGYETYMAFQQYKEGSFFQLFFGQGLGASIQLDVLLNTEDDLVDRISILHNGYAYTLVKFGIAGVFIYLVQCIRYLVLGLNAFADDKYEQKLIGAFIISFSVAILLLTTANGGFFNKRSFIPVFFFLAAFIRSRFYAIDNSAKSNLQN